MRHDNIVHTDYFRLLVEVFYSPSASLDHLASSLQISVPTLKRMLKTLRERGLVLGRAGQLQARLACLRRALPFVSTAIVFIELDIKAFPAGSSRPSRSRKALYASEEEMLSYVKSSLAETGPNQHRILVEHGWVVMGDPAMANVLIVHAQDEKCLFNFVRRYLEPLVGIKQTRTLMIADGC